MIESEFEDAKGRLWFRCDWCDAVREDFPGVGMRNGRWTAESLKARAWLSPTGRVWVLECADPGLAACIRRSVSKRAPRWRSEWVDRKWRASRGRRRRQADLQGHEGRV